MDVEQVEGRLLRALAGWAAASASAGVVLGAALLARPEAASARLRTSTPPHR